MSRNILIIAAHPDDEILGCGATMAKCAIEYGDDVRVLFIADGVGSRDKDFTHNLKNRHEAAHKALSILKAKPISFLDLPDNQLDKIPLLEIVKKIENVVQSFQPQIIYTHHFGDLNIDHAIVHRAVMTACRPLPSQHYLKEIYAFEVLSATEWALGQNHFVPNLFVDVNPYWDLKLQSLEFYNEEMREFPHTRSFQNMEALATYRGATHGLKKAEAFVLLRKIVT
jgi:LmbE family N-acetylglucosaminyl deacetylase